MNEEQHVISYLGNDFEEHIIFCDSKEEAEIKAKELKDTKNIEDIMILSREEFDESELMML